MMRTRAAVALEPPVGALDARAVGAGMSKPYGIRSPGKRGKRGRGRGRRRY
jgi:hypothetical protein